MHKAIHIAKSLKANHTSQNLSISMSLPTLTEKLTKFNNTERMKKAKPITKAIKNRRDSSNIKVCSPFELYRKLKLCASKCPTLHTQTVVANTK